MQPESRVRAFRTHPTAQATLAEEVVMQPRLTVGILALKTKAGLRLRRTSVATVWAPPRSAKSGKGMGGVKSVIVSLLNLFKLFIF